MADRDAQNKEARQLRVLQVLHDIPLWLKILHILIFLVSNMLFMVHPLHNLLEYLHLKL